jgi:hypothetical protein
MVMASFSENAWDAVNDSSPENWCIEGRYRYLSGETSPNRTSGPE